MKRAVSLIAITCTLSTLILLPHTNESALAYDPLARAVAYLESKPANPWTTIALVAYGETNMPADHLKTVDTSSAVSLEAPILAIAATGNDPRTYAQENLVAKLKSYHTNGQIGDPGLLNDDVFGILALSASGEPPTDAAIQDAKATILAAQRNDGSWEDTNMTAVAIQALIEAGMSAADAPLAKALAWLKDAQNDDGGFPYAWPVNPYTGQSDPSDSSSSSWVAHAIIKSGQDPTSSVWEKNGNDAIDALLALQQPNGSFAHSSSFTDENSFTPISTAYAAIALLGKSLPVARYSPPRNGGGGGVSYRIEGSQSTVCAGTATLTNQLKTAMDIIPSAAHACGFTYEIVQTSYGPYLKTINNDAAQGPLGWLYRVNGILQSVGAADFTLQDNDAVLWYFGQEQSGTSGSIALNVNVTSPAGGGGGSTPTQHAISFTVEPSSLDFGNMVRDTSASKTLTLANTGTVGITLTSSTHGDSLFLDHMQLDHASWKSFTTSLNASTSLNVDASLTVPQDSSAGVKQGMLIFWAQAQ